MEEKFPMVPEFVGVTGLSGVGLIRFMPEPLRPPWLAGQVRN